MTDFAAALLRDVPRYEPDNPLDSAPSMKDDPQGDWLSRDEVLAALSRALDPAIAERAGEVLPRLRKADEYEPLGHDGWEAADLITTLLTANTALRAERDELSSKLEVERALTDAVHRLAKAAEAQNAALTARVEGLTGAGKALASWCVKNIQLNLEMDTALHALDAALSATEATDDPR